MHFFTKDSKITLFLEKWEDKKLFNFKVIYFLCISEEMQTLIFHEERNELFLSNGVIHSVIAFEKQQRLLY